MNYLDSLSKSAIKVVCVSSLSIVFASSFGCQAGRYGSGMGQQGYGGGYGGQPIIAPPTQPPYVPYEMQNRGAMQPNMDMQSNGQAAGGIPQFGRNIADRFANGFVNRGINSVIDSAIRMSGL